MPNTLYISDLDGTLLDNSARLADRCRTTLCELLADGLPFTVASARSLSSIAMMLKGVPITLPVVEFNGAFLSDLATGRHEIVNGIDRTIVEDLHELLPRFGVAPFISTFDGTVDRLFYKDVLNGGMEWYRDDRVAVGDRRLCATDDLSCVFDHDVVCVTIIGREPPLAELHAAIAERHGDHVELHRYENDYSPGWHWLTVHDRRATKDQGIRLLRERYGLADHELVVFGDHHNDVKMFALADRAVAVANAIDAVKACATEVIGSNEEGSVPEFIRGDWTPGVEKGSREWGVGSKE